MIGRFFPLFKKGFILLFLLYLLTAKTWADSRILINLPAHRLYLYHKEDLVKDFPITIGRIENPTPIGSFHIVNMIRDPIWWPPDGGAPINPGPSNPLGTRWLGLNIVHYGIHGNNNPLFIGQSISRGCIRMYNQDVEYLFSQVKLKTRVDIIYQLVDLYDGEGGLGFILYKDVYRQGIDPMEQLLELLHQGPIEGIYLKKLKDLPLRIGFTYLPFQVDVFFQGEKVPAFRDGKGIWVPNPIGEEGEREGRLHFHENEIFATSIKGSPVYLLRREGEVYYLEILKGWNLTI